LCFLWFHRKVKHKSDRRAIRGNRPAGWHGAAG
jgi:hypothetical protein